ncbi:MAG: hypothetical protein IPG78_15105 [Ignavibacteria bacterium]|nr:hypothetical protein [Ignavibacteria bacterium]
MTKKILYFVLLSVLIMSVGYDIQTGRIQFGSSRINDSTSALMTMNKGLLINGDLYTPDAGKFYIGDNYLNGLANNMGYYSTTHTFYSQDGTTIATFDSASGITFAKDFIPTWTKNNSSVAAYQYEKTKIVAGKLGALSSNTSIAHGITDWHTIKSYTVTMHDDSANVIVLPNMYASFVAEVGRTKVLCLLIH